MIFRHLSVTMLHRASPVGRAAAQQHARLFSAAVGTAVESAKAALARADAVCFDVDSTVITEEGIDVLAAHCGAGAAVAELTASAMGGTMLFQDALKARLDLIRPSTADVAACLAAHPPALSPGVAKLVDALQARGTHVYLVSGGFRLMIEPVAATLGVPKERIFANTITFGADGAFEGFDPTEFTSADQGKPRAVAHLKETHGYNTVVMVGDGATDMQAKAPGAADAFVGFGGVAVRDAVQRGADWFVTDFDEMTALVNTAAAVTETETATAAGGGGGGGGGDVPAAAEAEAEAVAPEAAFFEDAAPEHKVFVANLPYEMTDSDLKAHFSDFGEVLSANVAVDRQTGASRGFGFVEMDTEDECKAAIEALHGKDLGGRLLAVELAAPPGERRARSPKMPRASNPDELGRKVYVGNLNFRTSNEELLELFSKFGEVVSCQHAHERGNPDRKRGFGFVVFQDPEVAEKAVAELNDSEVGGRFIAVRLADH